MTYQDIGFLIICINVSLVTFLTTSVILKPMKFKWLLLGVGASNLLVASVAASLVFQEGNSFFNFIERLLDLERMTVVLLLAGVTLGTSLGFAMALGSLGKSIPVFAAVCLVVTASNSFLSLVVVKETISSLLPTPEQLQDTTRSVTEKVASEYIVDQVVKCNLLPSAVVCQSATKVFVAGYSGAAFQNGGVSEVRVNDAGVWSLRTVARYLNRPHGLAISDGDLFVSRAGQFTRAVDGKMTQEPTGFVTRLKDLDGDGIFDYYKDVVSDLPGALLPDGLHQNNGIAFSQDGWLYITVGSPSDHGPGWDKYSGTILRCRKDGSGIEIFASGFRNPYGIGVAANGDVFCTDNDSDTNSNGDELNYVQKDLFYGHPYSSTSDNNIVENSVAPIDLFHSAQAICVHPTESTQDRTVVYVAAFGEDTIYRMDLTPKGSTFTSTKNFVAAIPSPIGISAAPDGTLFVCSHKDQGLYRITRK